MSPNSRSRFTSLRLRAIEWHAGAADPAVAARVLGEVLLVIVLGEIEVGRVANLGGDGSVAVRLQRRLIGRLRLLGLPALLVRVGINRRPVLGANVIALA